MKISLVLLNVTFKFTFKLYVYMRVYMCVCGIASHCSPNESSIKLFCCFILLELYFLPNVYIISCVRFTIYFKTKCVFRLIHFDYEIGVFFASICLIQEGVILNGLALTICNFLPTFFIWNMINFISVLYL